MDGLTTSRVEVAVVSAGEPALTWAHARALGARGLTVLVVGLPQDLQALHEARRDDHASVTVRTAPGDPAVEADWTRWSEIARSIGRLRMLVTLARPTAGGTLLELTRDRWQQGVDSTVRGAFLGMKVLGPLLRDDGGGAIVHVTSTAALDADADPVGTATAWAVRGLTKTAAQELGPWQVRVSSVHHGVLAGQDGDPRRRAAAELAPLRRAGSVDDVAELVAHLGSDAATFVTGAEVAIDGGWTSGVHATYARHPR